MANDRFFVGLDGFEELFNELNAMSYKGEKATSKALRAGGQIFLDLAKSGVNFSNRKSDKHPIASSPSRHTPRACCWACIPACMMRSACRISALIMSLPPMAWP